MNTDNDGPRECETTSCELKELRRALASEQERNLRLFEEFETFRRRVAREREAAVNTVRREALLPIVPVLDTLDRALAAGSTDEAFYDGVMATERMFVVALRAAGATPVESVGRPFDPKEHDAVSTERVAGFAPGTVVRELRRGWRVGNELLRAAEVVVAAAPEAAGPRE